MFRLLNFSFQGNYTEADAADLTRAIVEAIAYLHKKDIAHRDLVRPFFCVFVLFDTVAHKNVSLIYRSPRICC